MKKSIYIVMAAGCSLILMLYSFMLFQSIVQFNLNAISLLIIPIVLMALYQKIITADH